MPITCRIGRHPKFVAFLIERGSFPFIVVLVNKRRDRQERPAGNCLSLRETLVSSLSFRNGPTARNWTFEDGLAAAERPRRC
jgi:hypothetical protein